MAISDRVLVTADGTTLAAYDSPLAKTATARQVADYRAGIDRTQRQAEALNALVMRRRRKQKRKGLSPWAARQPVAGALSAARPPARQAPE